MPQRARNFKVDCCLKFHNAHLKLLFTISGSKLKDSLLVVNPITVLQKKLSH